MEMELEHHRFRSVLDLWITGVGSVIAGDMFGWTTVLSAGTGTACVVVCGCGLLYAALGMSVAELAVVPTRGSVWSSEGGAAHRLVAPFLGDGAAAACAAAEAVKLIGGTAAAVASVSGYACELIPGADSRVQVASWVGVTAACALVASRGAAAHAVQIATTSLSLAILAAYYSSALAYGSLGSGKLRDDDDGSSSLGSSVEELASAIAFSAWFFLGLEGLPLASPLTSRPTEMIPKAIVLVVCAMLALALATVLASASLASRNDLLQASSHPLLVGFRAAWGDTQPKAATALGACVVFGLVATLNAFFFYSAELVAQLARDFNKGSLSSASTSSAAARLEEAPVSAAAALCLALFAVLAASLDVEPVKITNALVWFSLAGAFVVYEIQLAAFLVMRSLQRDAPPPWRSPIGAPGAVLGIALGLVALASLASLVAFQTTAFLPGALLLAAVFAVVALAHYRCRRAVAPGAVLRDPLAALQGDEDLDDDDAASSVGSTTSNKSKNKTKKKMLNEPLLPAATSRVPATIAADVL